MNNKLKICVIGCRFNHPLGERVLCMWRYIAEKYGIKVHIVTTDRWIDTKGDSKLKNSKNLKIHKLTTIGAKHGQFKHTMPGLLNWLVSLNPDVIYAQEEPIQAGVTYPAFLVAKILRKPFIFFTWENKYQEWFFPIGFMENQIIKGSDLLIAGTEQSKEILIRKGADENKIVVLPETGIDTQRFKPIKNKADQTIIYIGRLVKEKGINVLLKAREHLIKKGKHYKYLFVGNGPLRAKLERLAKKNKDIILPKSVPYEQVPKLYHKGNIFFYASLRTKKWEEQYGYSMLEALASGLPVISTKGISGPEAIVKDLPFSSIVSFGRGPTHKIKCGTGFLIKEGNHKELAKTIELLMEHEVVLKQMSINARKDAIKRLSKEAVAKRTVEVLKKLVKG